MIDGVKNNNSSYIDIISEFRNLIDFINYNDVLVEKMFEILMKHFEFEVAGIFFNTPDTFQTNVLELCIKNVSLNVQEIENKFFQSMSEFKQIIKRSTKLHYQAFEESGQELSHELILPFMFNGKLLGGMCIFSDKDMLKDDMETFNFLINEFLSIYKLKYIYTEQIFKSCIDSLTGLYNRRQFDIGLEHEFNRAQRYKTPFSIAMIDIDHFKNINDSFGHQFGDYVLKEISGIIQHSFRKTDMVYRYGGEEIVIIMPETDSEHASLPLERLRERISSQDFNGQKITISIGVSDCINKNSEAEILKKADEMLYNAKESGRNKVCL